MIDNPNTDVISFIVCDEDLGCRIDKVMMNHLNDFTRNTLQKYINDDLVRVNGAVVSKNYKVRKSDEISVEIPPPVMLETVAENIPIEVAFEDDDLIVVNKAKGMVVHPAVGNYSGTLVNALLYYCGDNLSGINGVIRPGIVHRIDKDTSGLLIVAKNDFAHQGLASQIKEHSFTRKYEAVVCGNLKEDTGTINLPIGRHPVDRKKMAVTNKGSREAITHFKVINRYRNFTHVELTLETGRTHQIRVHMAALGHPVAGDMVYGNNKKLQNLQGQCLHAKFIAFEHPRDKRWIEIDSDLPEYFSKFLSKLTID